MMLIFVFIVGVFYAVAGQAIVTNVNPLAGMTNNAQSIFYHNGTHGGWNIIYPIETKHRPHFIVKESNIETINKIN